MMIYLVLTILCSALMKFVFTFSEQKKYNRYAVTSINYLVAFISSMFITFKQKIDLSFEGSIVKGFLEEVKQISAGSQSSFSAQSTLLYAVILGCLSGITYYLGLISTQKSISRNGVSITSAFSRLSIIFPILLSLIFWRNIPTVTQVIGILFMLTAIGIMTFSFADLKTLKGIDSALVVMFLVIGFSGFNNKLFQRYALGEYKTIFLFCIFFTAFVISTIQTIKKGQMIRLYEVIVGISVGIPNILRSYFFILSLDYLSAAVAFPASSAGGILMVALGGRYIFKERLKTKEKAAIAVIIIGIILINIKM
ncbi:MAG: hypothetical protein MJB14_02180 [Spirochaetes bacterium]|nr:hypothetical protein [Spirochaetota bacterium]